VHERKEAKNAMLVSPVKSYIGSKSVNRLFSFLFVWFCGDCEGTGNDFPKAGVAWLARRMVYTNLVSSCVLFGFWRLYPVHVDRHRLIEAWHGIGVDLDHFRLG